MDLTRYMLPIAEEDGLKNLVQIGAIVLFLVIAAIAWVAGKLKEKAQRSEALRQEPEQGLRREPPPRRPQATPAEEQARAQQVIAQLFGIPQAEPASPPPPPPQAKEVPARLGEGVEEGVERLEEALAAAEAERHRRLDRLADHAKHVRAEDQRGPDRQARVRVDLSARREARTAIIYAEILGRPKGLRTDPELWDQ